MSAQHPHQHHQHTRSAIRQLRQLTAITAANIPDFGVNGDRQDHPFFCVRILDVHDDMPDYVSVALMWYDGRPYRINLWLANNSYHEYKRDDIFYVVIHDHMTYTDCMHSTTLDAARKYVAYICDQDGHIFDDMSHHDRRSSCDVDVDGDFDETESHDRFS